MADDDDDDVDVFNKTILEILCMSLLAKPTVAVHLRTLIETE